jgi:hypothetical protein
MRIFSQYPLYSGDMTNFTINPTFQYPKAHFSLRGVGSTLSPSCRLYEPEAGLEAL